MNTQPDLLPRLQALLTRWDDQAATAARRMHRSENPTAGAYYAGAMFGYEDCADDLAMLMKEVLAETVSNSPSSAEYAPAKPTRGIEYFWSKINCGAQRCTVMMS